MPFSAICPRPVSRWCAVHPALWHKDKPKTGLQTIGCHSNTAQVQIKSCTRKSPDSTCVWVHSEYRHYSPSKWIFIKINSQMFIGFGSPSLLSVPRRAHGLCFVAGQEHLHCSTHAAHSSCVPACTDSSVLFLALRCGECCSYSIQVLTDCPSYCFLWAHYSKASITLCQMLGFFAHVIEMHFFVCSVCMWMIPCAIKRFLVHALLVTTLKKHVCSSQDVL